MRSWVTPPNGFVMCFRDCFPVSNEQCPDRDLIETSGSMSKSYGSTHHLNINNGRHYFGLGAVVLMQSTVETSLERLEGSAELNDEEVPCAR